MELDVNVKFIYEDHAYWGKEFYLVMSFKLPNKLFKKKLKKYRYSTIGKTLDEFNESVIDYLNNEDLIKMDVENTVKDYIKEIEATKDNRSKDDEIIELIKQSNNMKLKIKIDE